jgi:hypothetical protein
MVDLLQVWLGGLMQAMAEAEPEALRCYIKSAHDLGIPETKVQDEYERLRVVVQDRMPRRIPTYEELAE